MGRVSLSLSISFSVSAARERERGIGGRLKKGRGWDPETVHEENIDAFRLEHNTSTTSSSY